MFYDRFVGLCYMNDRKPTNVLKELGLSASALGRWKSGSVPRSDALQKVADYFGVTTDYLLSGDVSATAYNSVGSISNSAVVQGNHGQNITATNGAVPAPVEASLSEQEEELLRVFRLLDGRAKTAVMSFLYEQEDNMKK